MMQIEKIIIYGKNGKRRILNFNLGTDNIISGSSKTGKSTIGQIIEYCLGSDKCNISFGIVRQYSDWFALLLKLDNEKCFVARKNPDLDKKFCNTMYYEIAKEINIPEKVDWESNIDNLNFEKIITDRLGIEENIHFTPINNTRPNLIATIKHALFYCFQYQYEIANPINLFHKESEDFVKQAIKDSMPYFFGAIDVNQMEIKQQLQELKRKLHILERKEKEQISIQGGKTRALQLLNEAVQVGLIEASKFSDTDDSSTLVNLLKEIEASEMAPTSDYYISGDNLSDCQVELEKLQNQQTQLNAKIDDVKRVMKISDEYNDERSEQRQRLESIGLFERLNFEDNICPFCSQKAKDLFPSLNEIKKSLHELDNNLENLDSNVLSLREYLNQLLENRKEIKDKILLKKTEIESIQNSIESAEKYKDLSMRRGRVIGRISLWLESYKEKPVDENEKLSLQRLIEEKESLLSEDTIHERMESIFNIVSDYMTNWVEEIDLEYKDSRYRFSPYSTTVFVDTLKEGAIPLQNLGSGSNWVGIHLLVYFAFQKYFISKKRPVPSFILIDQPSQIYFPNQNNKTDWEAVKKIYSFIHKRVKELDGKLQVIVLDHADFPDDFDFNNATLERWDKETTALIPYEWIDNK